MRARASTSDTTGGNCRTTQAECALRHFVEIRDILRKLSGPSDESGISMPLPSTGDASADELAEFAKTEFSSAAPTPPLVGGMTA